MASSYFHALATDYDGTLTLGATPEPAVLAALAEARDRGLRLLLVTGRTLAHLRADFPAADDLFDAIVGENGAVLAHAGGSRALAPPPPAELADELAARGVPFARGQTLLATSAEHSTTALAEIERLGLDTQLVRNRGELMLMPAGISKGTGLFHALGELGISRHNCIGIGDAENDHSLLEACELGVAVGNAVPSLKAHADMVLAEAGGAAVTELLAGPIMNGLVPVTPRRWQIELGADELGATVSLPASQLNVLVCGDSGAGKSYLAGLLAEQLITMGYAVCVLDPEGDHLPLAALRGVMAVGGGEPLPPPVQLAAIVRHRFGSVVADLSLEAPERRLPWLRAALAELHRVRRATGLPHWIIIEEAHTLFGADCSGCDAFDPDSKGLCLVTYRPEHLCAHTRAAMDVTLERGASGSAWLRDGRVARRFTPRKRALRHVRHEHKYAEGTVTGAHRFHFRAADATFTGRSAGNLVELAAELERAPSLVLRHHVDHGDFSRWLSEVMNDRKLALALRALERRFRVGHGDAAVLRHELVDTIREHGDH